MALKELSVSKSHKVWIAERKLADNLMLAAGLYCSGPGHGGCDCAGTTGFLLE
jgi:hypothetical protein